MVKSLAQLIRAFLEGPLTRPALLRWRRKQFLSKNGYGAYFGVFENFAAARAWLPPNPEFDQAALAAEYVDVRIKKVFEYDYPMIVWMDHAFRSGASKVLDIGGSVGVHYYAYRKYLQLPPGLAWRVVEVPSMVKLGREMAHTTGDAALTFTEDLHAALSGADIWVAAGSLQYFENARPGNLLEQCVKRPRHILLNKIPLYAGEDFVTAQNIDKGSFSPMHVYNRQRYIREIEALGYSLEDQWPVHERSLYLPGHPEKSFPSFSGLYFVFLGSEQGITEQGLPLELAGRPDDLRPGLVEHRAVRDLKIGMDGAHGELRMFKQFNKALVRAGG